LDEDRVDVHRGGLQEVQREHRDLLGLATAAGQLGVLAVEDDGVRAVPRFHDLQALVDLATQIRAGEVVADKRRAHGAAELLQRLVGGVLGSAASEAPQDLL